MEFFFWNIQRRQVVTSREVAPPSGDCVRLRVCRPPSTASAVLLDPPRKTALPEVTSIL
jgi:hypothetical protein